MSSTLDFAEAGFTLLAVCLAVLAGSTITLMTRMQLGTESDAAKMAAAVADGFILVGLQPIRERRISRRPTKTSA